MMRAETLSLDWQEYEVLEANWIAQQRSPVVRRRLRRSPGMQEQQRRTMRRRERQLADLALQIHGVTAPRVRVRHTAPPVVALPPTPERTLPAPGARPSFWLSLLGALRNPSHRLTAKAA